MFRAAMLGFVLAAGPPTGGSPPRATRTVESAAGFSTAVISHVNRVLGSERLPVARGAIVQPGVFITVGLERLHVFDREVSRLEAGRLSDTTIAGECVSKCPAAFFDVFQDTWLRLAVESSSLAVEIPERVLFAVDSRLPVQTLLQLAYAASESRPIQPPSLGLLISGAGSELRLLRFYLIPPQGLDLQQGSAALGLTVEFGPTGYTAFASDSELARHHKMRTLKALSAFCSGPRSAIRARKPSSSYPTKRSRWMAWSS